VDRLGRLTSLPITSGLIYRLSFIIRPFLTIHEKATRNWGKGGETAVRIDNGGFEESIVNVIARMRNANTSRARALLIIYSVFVFDLSLCSRKNYYMEISLGGEKQRERERGKGRDLHYDPVANEERSVLFSRHGDSISRANRCRVEDRPAS